MHTDLFSTGSLTRDEAIIRHIILHQSPIYSRFYLNFTISSFSGLLLEVSRTLKLVLIISSIDLEKWIVTEESSLPAAVSSSHSRSTGRFNSNIFGTKSMVNNKKKIVLYWLLYIRAGPLYTAQVKAGGWVVKKTW
ncbi:MAG: hypothetical protein IBX40_06120 [Methanosarcinales archaeon]|nr:hypothetical protein [Methanosarcinales archaeon]